MKVARGVVYVVYGRRAANAAKRSISTLKETNSLPIVVLGSDANLKIPGTEFVKLVPSSMTNSQCARWAKLNLLNCAPQSWRSILYLDADTEVRGRLQPGFKVLESGWDLAITPSTFQGQGVFQHIDEGERSYTMGVLKTPYPLQLQAGVMFVNRSPVTTWFFQAWQKEWKRFKGKDQAALVRALDEFPIRICLLGRAYNGGELIRHYFGRAR